MGLINSMSEFREIKSKSKKEATLADSAPAHPSLYFNFDEVPEMEKFKFGKEYEIALKVKPRNISQREDTEGKGGSIDLDILAIKVENSPDNEKSEGSYKERE